MQNSKLQFKILNLKHLKKILHFALCTLHSRQRRVGFTLIELLIYMGILSGLLFVLSEIFVSITDVQSEVEATSSVEQDGRFITARLSYDLKRATSISIPASIGATASSLQITVNGISYTYSLNNGNLELTNNLGTESLNSTNTTISNLNFKRIGNTGGRNTIQISFTLTSKTVRKGGAEVRSLQTTVGLREN